MSSVAIVKRLFATAGIPEPVQIAIPRLLIRSPRDRLVRSVAWYAYEQSRGTPEGNHLLEGVRQVVRGWDDFYVTLTLPGGASLVNVESAPPQSGAALITRPPRVGRGWMKDSISTVGQVRPEVELATEWLQSVVGCVVHEDCATVPALGLACAGAGETGNRQQATGNG